MINESSDSKKEDSIRENVDDLQPDDYQQYVDFFGSVETLLVRHLSC